MAKSSTRETLEGVGRGFAGALLFSLPLFMTMELWWEGAYIGAWSLVAMMVGFFPLLVGLSHFVGFDETVNLAHGALHAVVAYGIGIIWATALLMLLAAFGPASGWNNIVGRIVIQTAPAALGALLAQSHFGSGPEEEQRRRHATYWTHLFFMIIGALFVAMTIAPTDEVILLAATMTDKHLIVEVIASLVLLHAFTCGVGFKEHPVAEQGRSRVVLFFTVTTAGYALALAVSAALLVIFNRLVDVSTAQAIRLIVVLSLPATLGAAAARLTLDTE